MKAETAKPLIILKFGGEALANQSKIEEAANIIEHHINNQENIVVAVSAMAGYTNKLIEYVEATQIQEKNNSYYSEYDVVVSCGEQITCGLLAISLQKRNLQARSFMGWQVPIITTAHHSVSKVKYVATTELLICLDNNIIPIISGFQGITENNRITTLGRGGSDTTAVALAIALKADSCCFYKDVEGIYTADPKVVPTALLLPFVKYETMLAMSSSGAKILQNRAVELALKHNIKLLIKSTKNYNSKENRGSMIFKKEENLEEGFISAIVTDANLYSKINIVDAKCEHLNIKNLLEDFNNKSIYIDNFNYLYKYCNLKNHHIADLSLVTNQNNFYATLKIIAAHEEHLKYKAINFTENLARISIVGIGIKTNQSILQKLFEILSRNGITILMIDISDIKISLLVLKADAANLVNDLHNIYINS
ncbi:Aspartate kinase [Candidatus Hepatincolaceae symbiont of Richtersius coronifer]